jgi:hypothetical protein
MYVYSSYSSSVVQTPLVHLSLSSLKQKTKKVICLQIILSTWMILVLI